MTINRGARQPPPCCARTAKMPKSMRKRFSPYATAAGLTYRLGRGVHRAIKGRNGTRTNGKKTSAPGPITGESDWRHVYRRKPMPRRRRKRWTSFRRKVTHIIRKQVAPQFQVFARQQTITAISSQQTLSNIHTVLGATGAAPQTTDISELFNRALFIADINGIVPTRSNLRLHITGWMCETSIKNNEAETCYLDCYYWKTKRDLPSAIADFSALWNASLGDVANNAPVVAGTTSLSTGDYGVTPFQGAQLAKTVNIYKKVRVKIAAGGTCQLEQRSGRDYYRVWSFDEHYSLIRNCTEGIFFVAYGAPNTLNPVSAPVNLSLSTNVNYTWRAIADNRMGGMHTDQ